jgi:threonine/homoserine/homoserine lactone efflux protein
VFIAALSLQFLSLNEPLVPQDIVLTLTFMLISLLALSTYAARAVPARRRQRHGFATS